MNPRSWKIRTRLILAFAGVLLPYLALAGIGAAGFQRFWEKVQTIGYEAKEEMRGAADLQLAVVQLIMPANDYLITGDLRERVQFEERLARAHALLARAEVSSRQANERRLLALIRDQVSRMEALSREILDVPEPQLDRAAHGKMKALDALGDETAAALSRLHENSIREIDESIEQGAAVIRRVVVVGFIAIILSVAGGGALAFLFSTWLARPMLAIARGAHRMAEGDLSHRVDAAAGGELGETARAFNAMAERLETAAVDNARLFREVETERHRLLSLMQSANDAIILSDATGKILSWNRTAQTIFGYEQHEALGKPLTLLMPERYAEAHRKGFERLASTGAPHGIGKTLELSGLRRDGSEFPLELSLAGWKTDGETFFIGIVRDITERKRAEAAEHEAQALRQVAMLARAAAHEINNPLSIITGRLQLLSQDLTVDGAPRPDVRHMLSAASRIKEILTRMAQITRIEASAQWPDLPPILDLKKSSPDREPVAEAGRSGSSEV